MGGVQRRGGRAGHPGGGRAGHRMRDLLRQHVGHHVGRGPHPLADLRLARQAAGQPDLDVAVLIRLDPGRVLHLALADHRAGTHRRVHLVPGAIQEAGVDEHDPVAHRVNARRQIGRGAPFLVHHPHLDGVAGQAQQVLDPVEQRVGERRLVRTVHLGLDDIDRPGAAVRPRAVHVVQRDQAGDDRVEDALRCFFAIGQPDRRVGHQMPDVAHEQQAAPRQREARTVRRDIVAIRVQPPRHRRAALLERLGQVAAHQPQPVGIGRDLVRRIDRGDRILQVADRGQRRFQDHVGDPCRIVAADGMRAVDHHLDMQAVVTQQQIVARAPDQLRRVGQRRRAAGPVGPAAAGQRCCIVQERLGPVDHLAAARRVISLAGGGAGDRIGAVQRVVQAAPPRIGGVEQEPRVQDRHHQLRPGTARDLVVDVCRSDGEGRGFGDEVADVVQECLIGGLVDRLARAFGMPGVDLRLHPVARRQQLAIARGQIGEDRRGTAPEGLGRDPRAGQRALLDEGGQRLVHLQSGPVDRHVLLLCRWSRPIGGRSVEA